MFINRLLNKTIDNLSLRKYILFCKIIFGNTFYEFQNFLSYNEEEKKYLTKIWKTIKDAKKASSNLLETNFKCLKIRIPIFFLSKTINNSNFTSFEIF